MKFDVKIQPIDSNSFFLLNLNALSKLQIVVCSTFESSLVEMAENILKLYNLQSTFLYNILSFRKNWLFLWFCITRWSCRYAYNVTWMYLIYFAFLSRKFSAVLHAKEGVSKKFFERNVWQTTLKLDDKTHDTILYQNCRISKDFSKLDL